MMRMEGIKGGGARVGAGEDDMGDGMQCSDHPHRNNPGGICAFCLQEKLGKLVSSSFPLPIHPSSSSSSSPSFRSDMTLSSSATSAAAPSSSSLSFSARPVPAVKNGAADSQYHQYYARRVRLPFLLAKIKKKASSNSSSSAAPPSGSDIIFKRSKSSATPRRGRFLNVAEHDDMVMENFSPRKRNGFWSFLYLPSKPFASTKKTDTKNFRDNRNSPRISTITPAITGSSYVKQKEKLLGSSLGRKIDIGVEEDDSPNSQSAASISSFERKVSRSRSVGCGSRSFSGDFFERISTGFGDCTLRRVESQREGKSKAVAASSVVNHHHHHHQCMKERVKCAGIFSGLMMTSSSSSSSSSSYWVSSSADDTVNGKSAAVAISHGRARSWGWAFASPMRAFSTKTKRDIIRDASDYKNVTTPKPNLSNIPSLLAVGV